MFEVGVNSWTSVHDADDYFADMFGYSFWGTQSDTVKKQLLVTAFRWINASGYSIAPISTSSIVKNAQCELCYDIFNSFEDYKKHETLYAMGVRSFNFDGWSESLAEPKLTQKIQDMLACFKTGDVQFFNVNRKY
jgi:hypothetical protein